MSYSLKDYDRECKEFEQTHKKSEYKPKGVLSVWRI